jgi:hypothetical protein
VSFGVRELAPALTEASLLAGVPRQVGSPREPDASIRASRRIFMPMGGIYLGGGSKLPLEVGRKPKAGASSRTPNRKHRLQESRQAVAAHEKFG